MKMDMQFLHPKNNAYLNSIVNQSVHPHFVRIKTLKVLIVWNFAGRKISLSKSVVHKKHKSCFYKFVVIVKRQRYELIKGY